MITLETSSRIIRLDYDIGDVVYHRLADERRRGLVTGILVRPSGCSFLITWADHVESTHFAMELSGEFIPDYASSE
jgi:hypothetical protein